MAFVVEEIQDDAVLFRRINKMHVLSFPDKISSAAFDRERMSVNWERYSNAESTAFEDSPIVVALITGDCRELSQIVEHTPIQPDNPCGLNPNQAHSEVCGKKTKSVRQKLKDKAKIAWTRQAGV